LGLQSGRVVVLTSESQPLFHEAALQHVIVGSSQGANLLPLFHPDTPRNSPKVYADGDSYRDFAPLYGSLGLRVARDGSDADKLELSV
jgi:hypothetical protein